MQQISFADAVDAALVSLLSDRLALLAGAGLSMAPPSNLPSAARVASDAKKIYDGTYGATRAPLADRLEEQAQFFFERGELSTVYLRTLIDPHAFAGRPNVGHFAAADLLLVGGVRTAVTTNVDTLIETAGQMLLGHVGVGIDANGVSALPVEMSPLLKIHGCRAIDPDHTVWAAAQLDVSPVRERITSSADWLRIRLLDRDLLIVGYWTDWDYLNAVLGASLGAVRPARVIVVDPASAAMFAEKAPALYALGDRATISFQHVTASGADFLDALRLAFSRTFVRRMLHAGADEYQTHTGSQVSVEWTEPPALDNDVLWQVRRDLEGRTPTQPARERTPPDEPLIGLTLIQLRAHGAVSDGPYWVLDGKRIRVLRAGNMPLHRVQAAFEREVAPIVAPDIVVAVGAEALPLPAQIARGDQRATIARGTHSRWTTRADAVQELGL